LFAKRYIEEKGSNMDTLHISCALEWGADLFVSSDRKQLHAVGQAGIRLLRPTMVCRPKQEVSRAAVPAIWVYRLLTKDKLVYTICS